MRSVVPNPGIVIAIMLELSIPNFLYAATITKKARVESRPPEIPMTVFFVPICFNLFARAQD